MSAEEHEGWKRNEGDERCVPLYRRVLPIGMFRRELGGTDYWDVADLDSPP